MLMQRVHVANDPCPQCAAPKGAPCAAAAPGSYHRARWAIALGLQGNVYDDGILAHVATMIAADAPLRADAETERLRAQVAALTRAGGHLRDLVAAHGSCAATRAWDAAVRGAP